MNLNRRKFVSGIATLPLLPRLLRASSADLAARPIERMLFVYHPDGAYLNQWHSDQSVGAIQGLSESLSFLNPFREQLILLRNLNILDGNGDGHVEPAAYLLTGEKSQSAGSIDSHLADFFEAPLIHLGVQASKYHGNSISYHVGGAEKIADDSPLSAASRFLQQTEGITVTDPLVLKEIEKDLEVLKERLAGKERIKLDQHLKQLRLMTSQPGSCRDQSIDFSQYQENRKHDDKLVPLILRLQMEILLATFRCGLSPVGTLQISRHTSPMKMDFDWLERWDGKWPMESHQASHNDAEIHAQQKKWLNRQLAYLFQRLSEIPEPSLGKSGSMLDHTLVIVVTEVANGAAHTRRDMPFYLIGGRGSGRLRNGQVVDCQGRSHASLLASLAQLMGMPGRGGYASADPLNQILI